MTAILENIPLTDLTEAHLESLKTLCVSEGPRLEFKSELTMSSDSQKKELCKDVTALAHAQGGHLIFGVSEDNAVIDAIPGIEFGDQRQQQFLNILMNGLSPRLQNFDHHIIPLSNGNSAVVVRVVPDGQLHQVGYGDLRYYKRVGVVTVPMTSEDIATFLSASSGPTPIDRFNEFVDSYHGQLITHSYARPVPNGPFWTLVISPENPSLSIDLSDGQLSWSSPFAPLGLTGWNTEVSGRANYAVGRNDENELPEGITEYNEFGQIRAYNTDLLKDKNLFGRLPDGIPGYVPSTAFERKTVGAVHEYLEILTELGVNSPFLLRVSLLGVNGFYLAVNPDFESGGARLFSGGDIMPDTVRFESSEEFTDLLTVATKLRPAFDFVWREFGYRRSLNYDQQGIWTLR